jgi:hypothetical protein
MYYDEEFLSSLPEDHEGALLQIASAFEIHWEVDGLESGPPYPLVQETHALIAAYLERERLSHAYADAHGEPVPLLELTGAVDDDTKRFVSFMRALQNEVGGRVSKGEYAETRQKFSLMLSNVRFHYLFSDGDMARIQKLVNELRDLLAASEDLEVGHRRRVLGRLEKLQSELHEKMSDLSSLWGVLIEASMAARKLGHSAQPIVDRIREIASIAGPTQARTFGLPSSTPFTLPGQV